MKGLCDLRETLLDEGAICIKDLEGFSKELQDYMIAYVSPASRPE